MREMMVRLLEQRTGESLESWNRKIGLSAPGEVDSEVLRWLEEAYNQNCQ